MAGKSKIVTGALDALTDLYKRTFDPETYYHGSNVPDIKQFDAGAESSKGGFDNPGATYFTTDENYAHEYALGPFLDDNFYRKIDDPFGNIRDYVVKGPMEKSEAKKIYEGTNFKELDEDGIAPTIYPVKIKTKDLFDFENQKQVDDLISKLSPDPALIRDGTLDDVIYLIREGNWEVLEEQSIQKILKEKGYRGYKTSEPGTVGLFYPDKGDVRSIFAKFDPKKSESGEILASVPAAALATGGALSQLVDEDLDF